MHPSRDDFGSIAVIAPGLLQSPESRKLFSCPLPRSPCGHHRIGVRRPAVRRRTRTGCAWQAESAMPASVTSRARTIGAAAKNTPRAVPHSRRNAAAADGAPPTKRQIDDLDAELIADFLTHIETERYNGARQKLRVNTHASNDRDGRASTRRESGRLRV